LLGKKISDVFRDDPLVTRWVIAIVSAVLSNQDVDPEKIPGVIGGGVPDSIYKNKYDQTTEPGAAVVSRTEESHAGRGAMRAPPSAGSTGG
jgi:hypothetical protein